MIGILKSLLTKLFAIYRNWWVNITTILCENRKNGRLKDSKKLLCASVKIHFNVHLLIAIHTMLEITTVFEYSTLMFGRTSTHHFSNTKALSTPYHRIT